MTEKISKKINESITEKISKINYKYTDESIEILQILKKIQDGYSKRDLSEVDIWVKDLMDENVQIIGTNSTFPGDFEWRSGHEAAIEMFKRDWEGWGQVKYYIEKSEILIEDDTAWVTAFATVTQDTKNHETRNFEASKTRSLNRIKAKTEEKIPSTLALYQIIADASMILSQYELGNVFVWPIRASFGLKKKNDKWLIKQIHYSWPGKGFPSVRFT